MGKQLQVSDLKPGARLLFVPVREGIARGPKLAPIPMQGAVLAVTDYLIGCVKRGSLQAFARDLKEPPMPEPQPNDEPQAPDAPVEE
jgi:hypothetical protein